METMQQKVKNVPKRKLLAVLLVLGISLFGAWELKSVQVLNDEQHQVINAIFKEGEIFHKTIFTKGWVYNINREWLEEAIGGCILDDDYSMEYFVSHLTDYELQKSLRNFIFFQFEPFLIDENLINSKKIKIVKKDIRGVIPKISAPFIFKDSAIVYYQTPSDELIYYLKKNDSNQWETQCMFHIHITL